MVSQLSRTLYKEAQAQKKLQRKMFEEGVEKGIEEGIEKGMKDGMRKILRQMQQNGMSLSQIAVTVSMTEVEVEAILQHI